MTREFVTREFALVALRGKVLIPRLCFIKPPQTPTVPCGPQRRSENLVVKKGNTMLAPTLRPIPMGSVSQGGISIVLVLCLAACVMVVGVEAYPATGHRIDKASVVPLTYLWPLPADRNIDNVGPALANATQMAIERGEEILANYSSVLHGIAIPTGLAVTFFGYFLLAPVLFLAAFVTGGGACFIAVNAILDDATPTEAWIAIGAMLLGGALFGFIAIRALPVGMFAVGAALGVIFASSVRTTLIADLFPKDPRAAFIGIAVTLGLILGLLAVFFQKQMLIFSTAYAGAYASVFGIGHLVGHFPTTDEISAAEKGKFSGWVVLYLAIAIGLGTAGMFFQFWLAQDRPMPDYAPYDRRRRRNSRRRHRYEQAPWDDGEDDDWGDGPYIERIPLPPRSNKSDVRIPPEEYEDRRRPVETVYVTVPKDSQHSSASASGNASVASWNSVQQAPSVFEAAPSNIRASSFGVNDDEPVDSSHKRKNHLPFSNRDDPDEQGNPFAQPFATSENSRPHEERDIRGGTIPQHPSLLGVGNADETSNDRIDGVGDASPAPLVNVPLENESEFSSIKV